VLVGASSQLRNLEKVELRVELRGFEPLTP
jgi:hypothetical protein